MSNEKQSNGNTQAATAGHKSTVKRNIAIGMACAILIAGFIGVRSCSSAVSDLTKVTGSEGTATLAEFQKIQTGMSYAEVVKIIGGEGAEQSRIEVAGVPTTVMYAWDGDGTLGANMNAMFQGGRLISKAQVGLR